MPDSIADFSLSCVAAALYVYPVKSCAGLPVQELTLEERGGAVGDRGWAIVNAQDEVTWQGSHARLALVRPRFKGERLHLGADGFEFIDTENGVDWVPCQVKLWNDLTARHDVFDATDAGPAVGAWLERLVGAPLRLVRLGEAARLRENNNALHLVFSASVAAVDEQLAGAGRAPADPRRYRPNIVLRVPEGEDGVEFIEEALEALEWLGGAGATRLQVTALCVRCVVPNVDPVSGEVDETVLDTLSRLSRKRRVDAATVFGVYARGPEGARLRVGDSARMTLAL
jgi:uncharacterized protein YcbX